MEGKPERRRNVTPKPDASQPPAQQQPPPAQRIGAQETEIIPATPSQCGKFIQYDVWGKMFEVTSKYRPPIRILGAGAYGAVWNLWFRRGIIRLSSAVNSETNEKVAIKKIENPFEDTVNAKRALREIRLLQLLNHENVVAIKDVIPPRQREAFNDVYIVFELMDFDLQRAIYKAKSLNETHRQYFLYNMLRGLKYIHSASVLHRDMKPGNILLTNDGQLKICDFGLARAISETSLELEHVVTIWYRAPEILLYSKDSAAIDVWAVGCIFMEICQRRALFRGNDDDDQLRLVLWLIGTPSEAEQSFLSEDGKELLRKVPFYQRQSFKKTFPDVNPVAIDLVEKMLTFDPRQRITVEDALAHPYLSELHGVHDNPVCPDPISFDFEDLTVEDIKERIYQLALDMNPEFKQVVVEDPPSA